MQRILTFTIILTSLLQTTFAQQQDTLQTPHRTLPIDEVEIRADRIRGDRRVTPLTVSIIDRQAIDDQSRPSLLPTLTEQVPGLFITSRGVMGYGVSTGSSGGISIRGIGGSPTTGVMVLIDGHPQYMGLMGHPIADVLQSSIAERVEVVRGPASTLYGSNAMGGVVNIITRKMEHDGSENDIRVGYGSYNTFESELSSRHRKGRFSATVTGNYNRSDGHRNNMDFEQYGGSARLGVKIAEAWELSAHGNITHFNASNPGTLSAPIIDNDSRITRVASSVALIYDFDVASGALSLFYNWGEHNINDGYSEGGSPLDYRFRSTDNMAGVAWYQSAHLFNGNTTTVGLDYQLYGGRAANRFIDQSPDKEIANERMHNIAAYIDFRQSLTRWLTLDAGLRLDQNTDIGHEWVPKGGLSVQLPRNAQLKAVVAKGFRFPTIREMYMFPPQNADLKPEKLWSYELSFEQRLRSVTYGANIFLIDGENMIRTLPIDGRPKTVNTGRIENFGIEANLSWQLSPHLSIASNYSFLRMKYPVVAAPKHKFHASINYTRSRWSISTSLQAIGGLFTQTDPRTSTDFVLWNCNLQYRPTNRITLYARGENLLGQEYEINAGYPMPGATFFAGVKLTL